MAEIQILYPDVLSADDHAVERPHLSLGALFG